MCKRVLEEAGIKCGLDRNIDELTNLEGKISENRKLVRLSKKRFHEEAINNNATANVSNGKRTEQGI